MLDLGIQELIVILLVALLVFGPKRLPEIGRTIGKGMAKLKEAMDGVKEEVNAELHDVKGPLLRAKQQMDAEIYKVKKPIYDIGGQISDELQDIVEPIHSAEGQLNIEFPEIKSRETLLKDDPHKAGRAPESKESLQTSIDDTFLPESEIKRPELNPYRGEGNTSMASTEPAAIMERDGR